jgi:hypothetical protein
VDVERSFVQFNLPNAIDGKRQLLRRVLQQVLGKCPWYFL